MKGDKYDIVIYYRSISLSMLAKIYGKEKGDFNY